MNQKTALAVIIALLVIFVLAYLSFSSNGTGSINRISPAPSDVPQEVSLRGEFVCLPLKDTTSPQTTDCVLGVRTDNNVYYAIDATGEGARNMLLSLQTGLKIQIDGVLVPIEQISSSQWQKYDIGGIVSTENILRI
jgi:hypothetical protein